MSLSHGARTRSQEIMVRLQEIFSVFLTPQGNGSLVYYATLFPDLLDVGLNAI